MTGLNEVARNKIELEKKIQLMTANQEVETIKKQSILIDQLKIKKKIIYLHSRES